MSCCTTDGANKFFSKGAKRYAKTFLKKGPDKASTHLILLLTRCGIASKSVLDIGCGVGGVHLTLLKNGASSATGTDVAEGMLAKAKELAATMGFTDKVRYFHGDVAAANGSIPSADIVVLDKVLCCSDDPDTLITKSTEKCREFYAVSYPRGTTLARMAFRIPERLGTLMRWSFHPYYYEPALLDDTIRRSGFEEASAATTVIWQVKVFRRKGSNVNVEY